VSEAHGFATRLGACKGSSALQTQMSACAAAFSKQHGILHRLVMMKPLDMTQLRSTMCDIDKILTFYEQQKQFARALVGVAARQLKCDDKASYPATAGCTYPGHPAQQ
jgi:hypothetical protein